MTTAIPDLIDKLDTVEIVRDQIAAILATEVVSQMALATAAAKDPDDWKLRIFTERSNPWENWLNDQIDRSPIVNVWIDNLTYDPKASNISERQKTEVVYNIDCYGYGQSADVVAGGHIPGDREAAFEAQRAIRLVRNILMAAGYTYLDLRGTVWSRWPQSVTFFQPQIDGRQMQQVVGARLAFRAEFNELSPQMAEETLEFISTDVKRTEDGEIVAETDYAYPLNWLPSDEPGGVFWYRYNTGITVTGSGVSQWNDAFGLGHHLKQATDLDRPSKEANGSILFDGLRQFLKADVFTWGQPETIVALVKQVTWTSGNRIFDGFTGNTGNIYQADNTPEVTLYAGSPTAINSDFILDTYAVVTVVINGASSFVKINNETEITGDAGILDMNGFTLGSFGGGGSSWSNIQVKEVIGYAGVLDEATLSRAINYLAVVGGLSI